MSTKNTDAALQQLGKVFLEIPFNRTLGLRLEDLAQDHITMSFAMNPDLIGNYIHGILHGGVISSVLDMAGGMAAMVSLIYKQPAKDLAEIANILGKTSTIDLHVNYLLPGKGSFFTAKANVKHSGNKICFTNMELFNDTNTLLAKGSGTYLIG